MANDNVSSGIREILLKLQQEELNDLTSTVTQRFLQNKYDNKEGLMHLYFRFSLILWASRCNPVYYKVLSGHNKYSQAKNCY